MRVSACGRGRAWWMAGCVLFLAAVQAAPAKAHLGSTKYIEVARTEEGARVTVAIDVVDAGLALGLGLEPDEDLLLARAALLERWIVSGLEVAATEGACTAVSGEPVLETRDGKRFVVLPLSYRCAQGATGLVLRDATVFDTDPDHQAFVSVDGDARVLRGAHREIAIDDAPSVGETAVAFLVEGGWHLFTGFDHLLFLISLLLGGTLALRRRAMREAAVLVTAFTIGHSVSLVASALGWVVLPSGPVELCIALSIIVVAAMNLAGREPTRARAALALAFGVIHGFGFASVLGDVGLPTSHRVLALFSFNLGIELAQLAFVAVALPVLAFVASAARERLVVRAGSVAIAVVAAVWVVERIYAV